MDDSDTCDRGLFCELAVKNRYLYTTRYSWVIGVPVQTTLGDSETFLCRGASPLGLRRKTLAVTYFSAYVKV